MIREKRWQVFPPNPDVSSKLASSLDVHPVTAQVLLNRKIRSIGEAKSFIHDSTDLDYDSFFEKDLDACKALIESTIAAKKGIMVFGDYDVDGMTSTTLMMGFLKHLGARAIFHIPSRFTEGYGLNTGIIDRINVENIGLLITLDCGVTNVAEIKEIKERTTASVIVMDHHTIPDEEPPYDAMLNPKALPEDHDLFWLCTAGVVFEFIRYFVSKNELKYDVNSLLDIVALGTIADIARLKGANRGYVRRGLSLLSQRRHLGLRVLMQVADFDRQGVTPRDVGFVLGPRLNAAGRLAHAAIGAQLLMSESQDEAEEIARRLEKLNQDRRQIDTDMLAEALNMVQQTGQEKNNVIVVSGRGWHPGVIGITASKLVDKLGKPVVVIADDGELARGSARSIGSISIYSLLKHCSEFFENFGGHKEAAGFSILPEKIEAFKEALTTYANETVQDDDLLPIVNIDLCLPAEALSLDVIEDLKRLEPFGHGNDTPIFYTEELTAVDYRAVGDGSHLKVTFRDATGRVVIDGIGFYLSHLMPLLQQKQPKVAFQLDVNEWQGKTRPQLQLVDIK
jgi:single-stranded-DNA-specific exonuclease